MLNPGSKTILPVVYDSVSFRNSAYHTMLNNKHGLLAFNTNDNSFISLPPVSPVPLKNIKRFRTNYPKYQPYIVFEQYDPAGNLSAYYDKKGFAYSR